MRHKDEIQSDEFVAKCIDVVNHGTLSKGLLGLLLLVTNKIGSSVVIVYIFLYQSGFFTCCKFGSYKDWKYVNLANV